jgi:hypothetical protein
VRSEPRVSRLVRVRKVRNLRWYSRSARVGTAVFERELFGWHCHRVCMVCSVCICASCAVDQGRVRFAAHLTVRDGHSGIGIEISMGLHTRHTVKGVWRLRGGGFCGLPDGLRRRKVLLWPFVLKRCDG